MNAEPLALTDDGVPENYLSDHTVRSWLLTTDHKRIGILYLFAILFFFAVATVAVSIIRIELLHPHGTLVLNETYNKLFTLHGVVMVWFFLIPSIPSVLGNFIIPLMIGARDVAFPKLNLLSWYLFMIGGMFVLYSIIIGGVDTGWTFYTPFSSTYSNTHVLMMAAGIFIAGFSSILTGLNFIVTINQMRAPGLTWFRLPLFIWSLYSTSLILVLATPVLAITLVLMSVERIWGIGIFDPKLGGDPILFQHLFWFYSHPAVYIMILPGMGVVSEVITCFSRKPVFGYSWVALASVAIAVIGFLVWGHHMFVSSQSIYAGMVFSFLSYVVAVPSAIKVFNWTATLYRGSITFETPMLYVLGFIGLFTVGGLTGLFLAALAVDVHVTDTYFVVAHFHYIMVGGMVLGFMAGLHYWWPKITGRMYPEKLSQWAAIITFIGFNLTFFPQFIMGYLGMPRRYHNYAPEFQVYHVLSTAGASILGIGYLLPLIYFIWSLRHGKKAPSNPWNATGLEWHTSSPPPRTTSWKLRLSHKVRMLIRRNLMKKSWGKAIMNNAAVHQPAGQFETLAQQRDASRMGMWTFIATEIMFFGGLFVGYTVYRSAYPAAFAEASRLTDMTYGTINTAILLTSSLWVALAMHAIELNKSRKAGWLIVLTIAFAAAFLGVKAMEYHEDFIKHLVPGPNFVAGTTPKVQLFFVFYWVMTGLHAFHVIIGIGLLSVIARRTFRGDYNSTYHNPLEMTGLYWHFVDIVWIFLYPLLYLIDRHL